MNDASTFVCHINGFLEGLMSCAGNPGEWVGNFFEFDRLSEIDVDLRCSLEGKTKEFILHLSDNPITVDELEKKIELELANSCGSTLQSEAKQKYIVFKILDLLQMSGFISDKSNFFCGTLVFKRELIAGNIYCFRVGSKSACLFFGKRS